eukprot:jgi/Antlo1/1131/833
MTNSIMLREIMKRVRLPKTGTVLEFVPRRRGLGYVENYIVSEQDAVQQLFSKKPKRTFSVMPETPEVTKISSVTRRKG